MPFWWTDGRPIIEDDRDNRARREVSVTAGFYVE